MTQTQDGGRVEGPTSFLKVAFNINCVVTKEGDRASKRVLEAGGRASRVVEITYRQFV